MGIVQHHDAISGTEKQHVADDYVQRLSQGIDAALVSNQNTKIFVFFFIRLSIFQANLLQFLLSLDRDEQCLC